MDCRRQGRSNKSVWQSKGPPGFNLSRNRSRSVNILRKLFGPSRRTLAARIIELESRVNCADHLAASLNEAVDRIDSTLDCLDSAVDEPLVGARSAFEEVE